MTRTKTRALANWPNNAISVLDFGATGDGTTDDTAAIQAAINYASEAVPRKENDVALYFPSGVYVHTGLTVPGPMFRARWSIYGDGHASRLRQKELTGGLTAGLSFSTVGNAVSLNQIHSLCFESYDGDATGDFLSTQYVSNIKIVNCAFFNVPDNSSAIFVTGNPATGADTHGVRVSDCIFYNDNTTEGTRIKSDGSAVMAHSFIRYDFAGDMGIDEVLMSGSKTTKYCVYGSANATSIGITGSHIWGATDNLINYNGAGRYLITGTRLDDSGPKVSEEAVNASQVKITGSQNITITGTHFQFIGRKSSGLELINCGNVSVTNCSFYPRDDANQYASPNQAVAAIKASSSFGQYSVVGNQVLYQDSFIKIFDIDNSMTQYIGNTSDAPQVLTSNVGVALRSTSSNFENLNLYFNAADSNAKAALIAEPTGSWLKQKLHFCQNADSNDDLVTVSDSVMTFLPNGNIGINETDPIYGLDINLDQFRLQSPLTIQATNSYGDRGAICWDANYIYVCVAGSTWKRAALSAWT